MRKPRKMDLVKKFLAETADIEVIINTQMSACFPRKRQVWIDETAGQAHVALSHEIAHVLTVGQEDHSWCRNEEILKEIRNIAGTNDLWESELVADYVGFWISHRLNMASLEDWLVWFRAHPAKRNGGDKDTETHPSFSKREACLLKLLENGRADDVIIPF